MRTASAAPLPTSTWWLLAGLAPAVIGITEGLARVAMAPLRPAVPSALTVLWGGVSYAAVGLAMAVVLFMVGSRFPALRLHGGILGLWVLVFGTLERAMEYVKWNLELPACAVVAAAAAWVAWRFWPLWLHGAHNWISLNGGLLVLAGSLIAWRHGRWPAAAAAAALLAVAVALLLWGAVNRGWQPSTGGNVVAAAAIFLLAVWTPRGSDAPPAADRTPDGATSRRPSILLVTVDTLRADFVGSYGRATARTPTIDTMAGEGVLFADAHAPTSITLPSHASILTGLEPFHHGAVWNGYTPVQERVTTLAASLREHGYQTAAFISGYPLKAEVSGLAAGFDTYDDDFSALWWLPEYATRINSVRLVSSRGFLQGWFFGRIERTAAETTDDALRWLEGAGDGPFFAWVHFYDPHIPYAPPADYIRAFDPDYQGEVDGRWYDLKAYEKDELVSEPADLRHMIARYDGEVAYVDDQLARLVQALEDQGLYDDMLIVLASDHGESQGEHNRYFSRDLYQACLRVPLIMRFPRHETERTGRVESQVRLVDVAPTVWDYLGMEAPGGLDGTSLLPLIGAGIETDSRPAYGLGMYPPDHSMARTRLFSLRDRGYKLIWHSPDWHGDSRLPEREELYDVRTDPLEMVDIIDAPPAELGDLRRRLRDWRQQPIPRSRIMSSEEIERLRTLGYID